MNKLETALEYAGNGLAVFPLVPNGKEPITEHGFKDASTQTNIIKQWWGKYPDANIGIATGSRSGGLVVVDLDIKNNAHGIASFDEWISKEWLSMPETWKVRTWSGGIHNYYRSKTTVPSKVGWLSGVDIRAEGGYVVAAGSSINGELYTWEISPEDCDIATEEDECVWYLLDKIIKDSDTQKSEPFTMPDKVGSGERNNTLYKLACSLQAKGVSDGAIFAAVMEENRQRCEPPLSEDEVKKAVYSALRKEKGTAQQQKVEAPENTQKTNRKLDFEIMKPRSVKELMQMNIPEPIKFVGVDSDIPLLSEGSCVLAAKAKAGKSWFCTNLCWALTNGTDFLGYKTKQCKVQYYDLEQGEGIEQKRIKMVAEAKNEPYPDGFFIMTKLQRIGHGLEEQLEADMQNNPDIGVFIIDVFEKVRTDKKQTESDYAYTYRDFKVINDFAKRHHVSVILLFHSRKMIDPTDPFADILGSTAIQGASDQMIVLTKDKYSSRNTKLIAKGRTMDGIIEMEYVLEGGLCKTTEPEKSVDDDALEEFLTSEVREAVVQYMEHNSYWKGKCTGFITECAREGIGLDSSPLTVGKFLGKHAGKFMKHDGILVDIISNGSGGKTYCISRKTTVDTVATVDEWADTVDENPFNPL